jgi:hypothetical protein
VIDGCPRHCESASSSKLLVRTAKSGGRCEFSHSGCLDCPIVAHALLLMVVDVQQRPCVLHRTAGMTLHAGAAVLHEAAQCLQLLRRETCQLSAVMRKHRAGEQPRPRLLLLPPLLLPSLLLLPPCDERVSRPAGAWFAPPAVSCVVFCLQATGTEE